MSMPDPKALKKFADACRKAGIKSFKSPEFEFTLADYPPPKQTRSKRQPKASQDVLDQQGNIETDGLSEEDLLFWSVGGDT